LVLKGDIFVLEYALLLYVMALTMTLNLAEYYLRLVSIPKVCIDLVSTS